MAKLITLLFLFSTTIFSAIQSPFESGFSMGNLGCIKVGNDYTGRNPWNSAVFFDDTTKWSGAFYTTAFHSTLPEGGDEQILELGVGGVFSHKKIITTKVAISRFSAFKIYYEQNEKISIATRLLPIITPSVDFSLTKVGVYLEEVKPHRLLTTTVHLKANLPKLITTISLKNLTIYDKNLAGLSPQIKLELGAYSKLNRFGAQGVRFEITPEISERKFSLSLGEQVRLFKFFYGSIGFRTYPLTFAFGLTVPLKRVISEASFVQMGWLGWSQGFCAEFR